MSFYLCVPLYLTSLSLSRNLSPKNSRFLREEAAEGSDEDDGKRVVRSAKDKLSDDLKATIRSLENAKKIDDWVAIQNGTPRRDGIMNHHEST